MTTSVMAASAKEILAATAHKFRLPLSHRTGFVSSLRRTDIEWDEQTRREFVHISGEGWAYAALQDVLRQLTADTTIGPCARHAMSLWRST